MLHFNYASPLSVKSKAAYEIWIALSVHYSFETTLRWFTQSFLNERVILKCAKVIHLAQEAVQQNKWCILAEFMSIHFLEPQALAFPFHLTIDTLCSCRCLQWIIMMASSLFFLDLSVSVRLTFPNNENGKDFSSNSLHISKGASSFHEPLCHVKMAHCREVSLKSTL